MPIWLDPPDTPIPEDLHALLDGNPLVAQTLVRRGFRDPQAALAFLHPDHYTPAPPTDFPDMEKAAARLSAAIKRGETILVWGDFDVDGQTATTLLVEALRGLGANVTFHIPVRAAEGHGIKPEVLETLLAPANRPRPSLLLTCDTGIDAHAAVELANARGVDVIITDHHELPETLPPAHAILNPRLLPEGHPLGTLPGVGVAYKLVEAVLQASGSSQQASGLDLVALGIVADVAEQRSEARYLLQRGLDVLRRTPRLGLQTLMQVAKIVPDQLDETTIGFSIAPRLNALGRLDDANAIVELFTTTNPARAQELATRLETLNERRRLLTEQITQAALEQIKRDRTLLDSAALVLAHPNWHTGVVGIVASRLAERFEKPAVLLSIGEDGIARGSARSVAGVHLRDAIATQKALLTGFGGHRGAAGLSLPKENIPRFRNGLGRAVLAQLDGRPPRKTLQIDAYLPLESLSLELVDDLNRLSPFGEGNPPLTLATRGLKLVSQTLMGVNKTHRRLVVADEARQHQEVVWWSGAGFPLPKAGQTFDLAYRLRANTFKGERRLQLEWVDARLPIAESRPEAASGAPIWEAVDFRDAANPKMELSRLKGEISGLEIWAEGTVKNRVGGRDRNELSPAEDFAVWTAPPGPLEWQTALERVQPQRVYLFAVEPGSAAPRAFLERLAGLVKFALRERGGRADLDALAAATAQRVSAVRMGLLWLEAKGAVRVTERGEDAFTLEPGEGAERAEANEIAAELRAMLEEAAAYRAHFRKRAF